MKIEFFNKGNYAMSWTQVIGHDREKKILQMAIIDNKIAHAYLLQGLEGIGKEALGIEFAKAVNCRNPIKNEIDQYEACDNCKSCKEFQYLSSSNLEIIFPLPAGKTPDSKSDDPFSNLGDEILTLVNEEMHLKANDYYHKINIPKATQIKISSIRYLKKKLSLSGNVSGRRFVIISEAHKMTSEASNAFLKTLEEPHDNITILLCTSRPDKILQTINSRCQVLNCSPIEPYLIAKYIIDSKQVDEIAANLAAQFGQGSLTKAMNSVSEELKIERDLIVNVFRSSIKKNFRSELINQINEIVKNSDKNKVRDYLNLLLFWIRDGIMYNVKGNAIGFVNSDDEETIVKFSTHFKDKNLSKAIYEIENSIKMIDANVNVQLLLLTLFLKLRYNFIVNKN